MPFAIGTQIVSLLINFAILIAGLIAIQKIPFFVKNPNEKMSKGKKFLRLGFILRFAPISTLISLLTNLSGTYLPTSIYFIFSAVGIVGTAFLIYGAVLCYKGAKLVARENAKETTRPVFTANEEMSQKAQYAYTKFLNEYEQGTSVIDEVAEAKMFAKAVELQLLKTPASAVFCAMEEMSVLPIGEGAYSVSGYVDSQNSYGAMLRNQFNLTVFKDENGIWKNANRFISTAVAVNSSIVSHTILWWVLGIIGTIITLAVSFAFTSSMF